MEENLCRFKKIYICIAVSDIQLSRMGGEGDPINQFTPNYIFVPVSSQDFDFYPHMSWS